MSTSRFTLADAPFADGTGEGVIVAVVDSGIHADHPHVAGVREGVSLGPEGAREGFLDRLGHGTAVAAAIREKAPKAELLAIKVFEGSLTTSAAVLARGIVWAADRGARVINLSLGTANPERATLLNDAVAHAKERGALVVSAGALNGVHWLPGCLTDVIPVGVDTECDRDAIVVHTANGAITIGASAYPRPIPGVPRERNLSGVSFAVANVSGFLARLLSSRRSVATIADVVTALASDARVSTHTSP